MRGKVCRHIREEEAEEEEAVQYLAVGDIAHNAGYGPGERELAFPELRDPVLQKI